jgi:hypothetical protein
MVRELRVNGTKYIEHVSGITKLEYEKNPEENLNEFICPASK